jgi:reactive intermediate/imine deaminase
MELPMPHQFINPPTLPQPVGYTHVVAATGSRAIYVSGQVALDASGNLVGPGDARAQAQQIFANIRAALAAAGANFADVVKLTFFVLDVAHMPAIREVRDQYVNREHPPASSAVEVRRLVREEFLLEIEAIAVTA